MKDGGFMLEIDLFGAFFNMPVHMYWIDFPPWSVFLDLYDKGGMPRSVSHDAARKDIYCF